MLLTLLPHLESSALATPLATVRDSAGEYSPNLGPVLALVGSLVLGRLDPNCLLLLALDVLNELWPAYLGRRVWLLLSATIKSLLSSVSTGSLSGSPLAICGLLGCGWDWTLCGHRLLVLGLIVYGVSTGLFHSVL